MLFICAKVDVYGWLKVKYGLHDVNKSSQINIGMSLYALRHGMARIIAYSADTVIRTCSQA